MSYLSESNDLREVLAINVWIGKVRRNIRLLREELVSHSSEYIGPVREFLKEREPLWCPARNLSTSLRGDPKTQTI
jgi:hypothetical protein